MVKQTISTSRRVQRHRSALRAAGLRLVQTWLPDTRSDAFAAECRRQSLLVATDSEEQAIQQWLEQVADTDGWR